MGYIDAEKLIAEIERRIQRCEDCERDGYPDTTSSEATLKSLRSFIITSLQKARTSKERSEVDLEKEIEKYFSKWVQGASDEGCFNADSQLISIYDCHRIARHFYELGLNARKED